MNIEFTEIFPDPRLAIAIATPIVPSVLGKLEDPPIVEIACGFTFESIPELDPVLVGRFWQQVHEEFPLKELQRPILERDRVMISAVPLIRTWLIAPDEQRLIQLQHDRFHFNWRKREGAYPSFNPPPESGETKQGVLNHFRRNFASFCSFLEGTLGRKPAITGVEVTMVDVLTSTRHWKDAADLLRLFPSLTSLLGTTPRLPEAMEIRVERPQPNGSLGIVIASASDSIRFETTRRHRERLSAEGALGALQAVHADLKAAFVEFIPLSEHYRFKRDWRPQ